MMNHSFIDELLAQEQGEGIYCDYWCSFLSAGLVLKFFPHPAVTKSMPNSSLCHLFLIEFSIFMSGRWIRRRRRTD